MEKLNSCAGLCAAIVCPSGRVPCNNCGAGSQLSPTQWHMTSRYPCQCTICGVQPPARHTVGKEGCIRVRYELNTPSKQNMASKEAAFWKRHPKFRRIEHAKLATVGSLGKLEEQLQTKIDDADRSRLEMARTGLIRTPRSHNGHTTVIVL